MINQMRTLTKIIQNSSQIFVSSSIFLFSITGSTYAQNRNVDCGRSYINQGSVCNNNGNIINAPIPYHLNYKTPNGEINDQKAWDISKIKLESCYNRKNLNACDQFQEILLDVKYQCKQTHDKKICVLSNRMNTQYIIYKAADSLNTQNRSRRQ